MEKLDGEQVAKVNLHLAKVLRRRQKESGNSSIKIHQDKEYSENPMERVDVEETLTVQEDGIKVASKLIIIYNLLSHIPIKTFNAHFRTWKVCTPPVVRNAMLSSRWVANYSHVFTPQFAGSSWPPTSEKQDFLGGQMLKLHQMGL